MTHCFYCERVLDPDGSGVYRRMVAWSKPTDRPKAGRYADLKLREPRDEFACHSCIWRLESGLPIEQGSLL
jgi:hypothetical protein